MERRKRTVVLTCALTLAGCQSVKVQFVPASPTPAQGNDPQEIAKLASDGYSYFVLGTDYVLVAPAANVGTGQPKPSANPQGNAAPPGAGATGGAAAPSAAPASTSQSADSAANSQQRAAAGNAHRGAAAAQGTAHSGSSGGTHTGTTGSGSTQSGTDKAGTGSQNNPVSGTDNNTTPPALNNPLASTTIDNQSWTATAVPMADPDQAYLVKGVSGFWQSTTLGVARYQNSDLVSSLSVTAQNLVPTRISQIGGAIASLVTIAGALGASGGAEVKPLTPFYFKVPDAESSDNVNGDAYWTYTFKFDSGQPAGTVNLTQWNALVAGKKTVSYWPVPACRNATLTLTNDTLKLKHQAYQFQLVVASQQYVRLEPLPVSGKLQLGTVCGSSTNGTTTVDALGNVTDDLSALQKAIQQIKSAKSGKSTTTSSSQ